MPSFPVGAGGIKLTLKPNHQLSHLPVPLFPNGASCNLGWLQIHVAEEELELLLLPSAGITGIRF